MFWVGGGSVLRWVFGHARSMEKNKEEEEEEEEEERASQVDMEAARTLWCIIFVLKGVSGGLGIARPRSMASLVAVDPSAKASPRRKARSFML